MARYVMYKALEYCGFVTQAAMAAAKISLGQSNKTSVL